MFIIDMHCHSKEGSFDAHASIFHIVDKLKSKGFDALLITDHNSYKGYNTWKASGRTDFKVFKGLEYDSYDAGHILVILPDDIDTKNLLKKRMTARELANKVHSVGGIIGLAHPFDHGVLGMCNWKRYLNKNALKEVMNLVDFVEIFNSSSSNEGNIKSENLAKDFKKPGTGGSDSHRDRTIGFGRTVLDVDNISNNKELIDAILNNKINFTGGEFTQKTFVNFKHKFFDKAVFPYFLMERFLSLCKIEKYCE